MTGKQAASAQLNKRREDFRLIRGKGSFVDDIKLPRMAYVAFVRSSVAHGRIIEIDSSRALELPGVYVYTGYDLNQHIRPVPVLHQHPGLRITSIPPLAQDTVRYVGEPVAVVVANDRYTLEDARVLVRVEYEELAAVTDTEQALAPGAHLLYESWGTNELCPPICYGDAQATEKAFHTADHVVTAQFSLHRHGAVPLETRGAVALVDGDDLVVHTSTQVPFAVRSGIAFCLGLAEHRVRVIAPHDVGGGFGLKDRMHAEEVVVAYLARRLDKPVKWIEGRSEQLVGGPHAGAQTHRVEIALRQNGHVLALRDTLEYDQGAYPTSIGNIPALFTASMLPGPYRFTVGYVEVKSVCTNKPPSGAVRGFGMAEATTVIEGVLDLAAAELGLDPAEIRRRNLLQPGELGAFTSAMGSHFDSGRYSEAFERALALIDYEECRRVQREARAQGRSIGIGLTVPLEATGYAPSWLIPYYEYPVPAHEVARVQLDPDGSFTLFSGMQPIGQGIESALVNIASEELGVASERIAVRFGDTDMVPYSAMSSAGVRGIALGGNAVLLACRKLKEAVQQRAAHLLQVSPEVVVIREGHIFVAEEDTPRLGLRDLAQAVYLGSAFPLGTDLLLSASAAFDPASVAYGYAAHACIIALDLQTGVVELLKYVVVYDCGKRVNPEGADGQVVGGIVQGLGRILREEFLYDEDGQPLSGTLSNYLLLKASDVPELKHLIVDSIETPADNPGGWKGVGEIGTIGACSALVCAVTNALEWPASMPISTPFTPDVLWQQSRLQNRS
jgi:aerobic carbon-monoxide dehydrogenase large subunit